MVKSLFCLLLVVSPFLIWAQEDEYALELKTKAAEYAAEGKPDSAILIYDLIGKRYRSIAVFDSAYKYFLRGLVLREDVNDKALAMSHLYLGSVHRYREEYNEAAEEYSKAVDVATDTVQYFYGYNNLGSILVDIAHETTDEKYITMLLDSAERSLKIAEEYYQFLPKRNYERSLYWNFGHLEAKKENYSKAKEYYDQVKNLIESDSSQLGSHNHASVLMSLGFVNMNLRDYATAKGNYLRSLSIAKALDEPELQQKIYENLRILYHDFDTNVDSLLRYTLELDTLNYEILESAEKNYVEALKFQYENEQYNLEMAKQQTQIERASAERRLLIIIVMSLLLAGLIGYIINKRASIKREKEFNKINSLLKDQEIQSFNDVLEAQETERKRIASELHDKLGSTLSAAKLYLHHLVEEEEVEINTSKEYTKGMQLLDDAVKDVRTISHAMASGVLGQFGLLPALKDLEATITGTGKIKMQVHSHGLDERLPQNTELHIYRMIQELVSNALKHSNASEITVQLTQHSEDLNILVEDNGSGFDIHASAEGIGLKNIHSRADILGAKLNFDSFRGRGTIVTIDVPTT